MSTPAVIFRRLEIRRMPGFEQGGLTVEGLSPGVNLIYGPNGSGKTTLGRAIQRLLSPDRPPRDASLSLAATVELGPDTLLLRYEGNRLRCQKNGQDVQLNQLAAPDVGDRYMLALHDLIHEQRASGDQADLAAEIVRELAGGYDIPAARLAIGARTQPISTNNKLTATLRDAIAERKAAEDAQQQLLGQEQTLAELLQAQEQTSAAARQESLLKQALLLCDARAAAEQTQQELAQYPAELARLQGDELERLEKLQAQLGALTQQQRAQQQTLARHEQQLSSSGLPEVAAAQLAVPVLRERMSRVQTRRDTLERLEQELASAQRSVNSLRRAMKSAGQPAAQQPAPADPAAVLDLSTVAELSRLLGRAEKHTGQLAAQEALRDWVQPEQAIADPQPYRIGLGILARLIAQQEAALQEQPGEPTTASPLHREELWWGAAGIGLACSLLMAWLVHPTWLLVSLLILGGVVLWRLWPKQSLRPKLDPAPLWQREYAALGLPAPSGWDAETLRKHCRELEQSWSALAVAQEKAQRWPQLAERCAALAREAEQLAAEQADWTNRLGLDVQQELASQVALVSLMQQWQAAAAELSAKQSAVATAQQHQQADLQQIIAELTRFGLLAEQAERPEVEELAARIEQFATALQQQRETELATITLRQQQGELEARIGELERDLAALFTKCGLTREEEATLRGWIANRETYQEAQQQHRFAERELHTAAAALAEHAELTLLPRAELAAQLAACQQQLSQVGEISQKIGEIKGRISDAQRSHDLEAALAREDFCRDELRRQREKDFDALAAEELGQFLQRKQQQSRTTGLLDRARELFVEITHGRYRLDVHDGDPPAFRAFDTNLELGLALEELSSGTRLQLLLAARLAFVEWRERDVRLPLVLDEVLANSDDRRADLMIDAAVNLARQGRQVFYFTAQYDEVSKWQRLLPPGGDVPFALVDLAKLRGFVPAEQVPRAAYQPPEPNLPPAPNGEDWLGYGRKLAAPPFHPRHTLGSLHLWYLIEDLPGLHRLLSCGVNKWGQLKQLVEIGRAPQITLASELYQRALAAARAIEKTIHYWQIGRGLPVDRRVLEASGAVTNTYIEPVTALAESLAGDAKQLLAAIGSKQVQGFRANNLALLTQYLTEHQFLDERELLSREAIHEQVHLYAVPDISAGLISTQRVRQLVELILPAEEPLAVSN